MKCRHCDQEIALAKICPYCGAVAEGKDTGEQADQADRAGAGKRPAQGVFRGPIGGADRRAGASPLQFLPAVIRYFCDRSVAGWRKTAILLGLLYVISPLDLVPGALLPFLGWLDDAAVAALAWRLLSAELARYTRK